MNSGTKTASPTGEAIAAENMSTHDHRNPHNWPPAKKLFFWLGIVIASFAPTFSNSALYAIGFAVGPAFGSTASELWGRSWFIKGSLLLCIVFTLVSGSAKTFRTMIVARALAGIVGSASITPLLGVCNDLYDADQTAKRDTLISLYAIAMAWSSILGPIAAEAVVSQHNEDWSSALASSVTRDHKPEMRQQAAKRQELQGQNTLVILFKVSLGRPLRMLMVERVVLPCSVLVAYSQTIFFVLYVTIPVRLQQEYRFTNYEVGLSFLSIFVGSVIDLVNLRASDTKIAQPREKQRLAKESRTRIFHPRERLYGAMIGLILQPVSIFCFAWTCRSDIHWIVPVLALAAFGTSFALLQLGIPMYKNAMYAAQFGSLAMAQDLMLRYVLSSFFPLFTPQMIDGMTFECMVSMFAFLSIPIAILPWVLYRYGDAMLQCSVYLKKSSENSIETELE